MSIPFSHRWEKGEASVLCLPGDEGDALGSVRQLADADGQVRLAQSFKPYGEALLFSIAEGGAESFLEDRGLRMVDHLDNQGIERMFLLDEDRSLLGQITGHFRFVLASPE